MTDKKDIGSGIIEGLEEAVAWKRGEIALETVNIDPMPASRIRAIRKKLASSAKVFEERFGIPASTMNNWEQGRRKPDPAARLLLQIIEREPETVERIAQDANRKSAA
ncbi:helix-turn-helix domain-containing protein [Fodinicurvata fenggangensis]|uniref:helix-turn-helix domain-containing protein n=1 Tax=Fodinicurvata fenggangensis TaxID=1121830 RepID=UPI00047B955F|nr:transcriptional regulator [Fodinicurvata fenggangensis]